MKNISFWMKFFPLTRKWKIEKKAEIWKRWETEDDEKLFEIIFLEKNFFYFFEIIWWGFCVGVGGWRGVGMGVSQSPRSTSTTHSKVSPAALILFELIKTCLHSERKCCFRA